MSAPAEMTFDAPASSWLDTLCQRTWHPICATRAKRCVCVGGVFSMPWGLTVGGTTLIVSHGIEMLVMLFLMTRAWRRRTAVGRAELGLMYGFVAINALTRGVAVRILETPESCGSDVVTDFEQYTATAESATAGGISLLYAAFGFVMYQMILDGSFLSQTIWLLMYVCACSASGIAAWLAPSQIWAASTAFGVSHAAFAVAAGIHFLLQTRLVFTRLSVRMPLLYLALSCAAHAGAPALSLWLGQSICGWTREYIDGSSIFVASRVTGFIMLHKFWTSITEDEWDDLKTPLFGALSS